MEEKLKKLFPNLKINNSSNRDINDLTKIIKICYDVSNILVFIQRNEINNYFFEITEITEKIDKINLIFLNKDNIYYYNIINDLNFDTVLMSLKRKINNENECVVCFESCTSNFYMCCKCGNQIHGKCFDKCINQICSVCNNEYFLYNK